MVENKLMDRRPVMHLGGRLDGQARFSRMAFAALQAAARVAITGDRYLVTSVWFGRPLF